MADIDVGKLFEDFRPAAGAEGPAGAEKACPHCGKPIKAAAIRCKHCHADLKPAPKAAKVAKVAKTATAARPWLLRLGLAALLLLGAAALLRVAGPRLSWPLGAAQADAERPHSLRLARFRSPGEARAYCGLLRSRAGVKAAALARYSPAEGLWHEVRAGAARSAAELAPLRARLAQAGLPEPALLDYRRESSLAVDRRALAKADREAGEQAAKPREPQVDAAAQALLDRLPQAPGLSVESLQLVALPPDLSPRERAYARRSLAQGLAPCGPISPGLALAHSQAFAAALYSGEAGGEQLAVVTGELLRPRSAGLFAAFRRAAARGRRAEALELKAGSQLYRGELFRPHPGKPGQSLAWLREEGQGRAYYLVQLGRGGSAELKALLAPAPAAPGLSARAELREQLRNLSALRPEGDRFFSFQLERLAWRGQLPGPLGPAWSRERAGRLAGHWSSLARYVNPWGVYAYRVLDMAHASAARELESGLPRAAAGGAAAAYSAGRRWGPEELLLRSGRCWLAVRHEFSPGRVGREILARKAGNVKL